MVQLLDFALPTIHPASLLDELQYEEFEMVGLSCFLRVQEEEASLRDLHLLVGFDLLRLLLFDAAEGTHLEVEQGNQAHVTDIDLQVLVFSALGIQFVSFGLMVFFPV